MSDHKAEALRIIHDANHEVLAGRMTVAEVHAAQAAAQVHATLYLAEQQKRTADEMHLANLIAYVAMPTERGETPSDAWPLIDEGLGL